MKRLQFSPSATRSAWSSFFSTAATLDIADEPYDRVFHLGKITAETKVMDRDQLHANNGRMNAMMAIKEVAII